MSSYTGPLRNPTTLREALQVAVEELRTHAGEYEYRTHPLTMLALEHHAAPVVVLTAEVLEKIGSCARAVRNDDEYSSQEEKDDAELVLEWVAAQRST